MVPMVSHGCDCDPVDDPDHFHDRGHVHHSSSSDPDHHADRIRICHCDTDGVYPSSSLHNNNHPHPPQYSSSTDETPVDPPHSFVPPFPDATSSSPLRHGCRSSPDLGTSGCARVDWRWKRGSVVRERSSQWRWWFLEWIRARRRLVWRR